MKVKEFGAWPSRNISTGGRRSSFDEYNRTLKGSERAPRAEEYAIRNIEEYHHYEAQQDLTKEQDDKQESKRQKDDKARSRRMRIVQQVAVLAVGSVMVATSYNAMVAKREAAQAVDPGSSIVDTEPDDSGNGQDGNDNGIGATPDEAATQPTENPTQPSETVAPTQSSTTASSAQSPRSGSSSSSSSSNYSASWTWNADGTVMVALTDSAGNVVSEIAATVTTSEDPAGCKTEGAVTRTARAEYNGQTYTESRSETTSALGHSFDSGTEITLSDGSTAMDFECTRCHEHFVIKNSVSEE